MCARFISYDYKKIFFFKGICMGQSTREGGGTTSGGDQAYRRHAASAQQAVQKVNKIYNKKIKLLNCLSSKLS
jgi:hypothetical protein